MDLSRRVLRTLKTEFCRIRSVNDLAQLLELPVQWLSMESLNPEYRAYRIPKRSGGWREIEDPVTGLKATQSTLKTYLQACYYFELPEHVYGYVLQASRSKDRRNVLTNAQVHSGCSWLLNIDLKDFFHQVKTSRVISIFCDKPFQFSEDLATILANLTTYRGRLPMGAPTSPVLSNFALKYLDRDLAFHADQCQVKYSRYADDISFSGVENFSHGLIREVTNICENHGFPVNRDKVSFMGPKEEKKVTGLVLGANGPQLDDEYLDGLKKLLSRLEVLAEYNAYRPGRRDSDLEQFEQKIRGMVEFVKFVRGAHDPIVRELKIQLIKAVSPQVDHAAYSWLDFPYLNQD